MLYFFLRCSAQWRTTGCCLFWKPVPSAGGGMSETAPVGFCGAVCGCTPSCLEFECGSPGKISFQRCLRKRAPGRYAREVTFSHAVRPRLSAMVAGCGLS